MIVVHLKVKLSDSGGDGRWCRLAVERYCEWVEAWTEGCEMEDR